MAESDTTLIYVPGNGGPTRTFILSPERVRRLRIWGGVLAGLLAVLGATWIYFGVRSLRVSEMEARIAVLEEEREHTAELVATLEALEERYDQIRALFGAGALGVESETWLPPPAGSRADRAATAEDEARPSAWPLTQRGFVTQPLLEGADAGGHPGLDIAVAADSYIRASGAGAVVEAGEDPVYGRFIVLDHGNGYRTRYAHASLLLVEVGREVRRHEVIALSGNTGRSTAPHLHFEILFDGEAVDPLSLVRQPS